MRTDTDFITYDYTPITKIDDKTIVKTMVEPDEAVKVKRRTIVDCVCGDCGDCNDYPQGDIVDW